MQKGSLAYDFLTTVDVSEIVVAAGELVICHQGGEDDRLVDKDPFATGAVVVLGAGHGVIPRLQVMIGERTEKEEEAQEANENDKEKKS